MDEERLAGLEVGGQEDVGPDRAGHLGQGGGVDEVDTRRDREQLAGRHADLLGVAAARQQRAHLVADDPAVDAVAHGIDDAGDLQPGILGDPAGG